ncbi:SGNH/GDSL hydrolase family protein [Mycolicibacterium sp. 018/SC-01/001]|uniref:SGNH/GDSL hydrolase family protein n=1 Tax=Mycolicibacterium sp. 018/SC-01/001 TaxID=2592069 RepID=UPI0021065712|nr:SGNH/GDSL hydrolase family protein [Mycolicibacterium sp. 018/SC-01/001]
MMWWCSSWRSVIGAVALSLLLVAATASATVVLTSRGGQSAPIPADGPLRISVIGDSYSAGSDNDVTWPSLIAAASPLSISNVAVAGSSYAGRAGQSGRFADQVDKALASKPDMIVVFGGIGDVTLPAQQITQSAVDLFTELSRRAPDAALVVFGPIWHQHPVPDVFMTLDSDIAEAANITHTRYVPLIGQTWLTADGLMRRNVAPTDEGQSVLAQRLGTVLLQQVRETSRAVLP